MHPPALPPKQYKRAITAPPVRQSLPATPQYLAIGYDTDLHSDNSIVQ